MTLSKIKIPLSRPLIGKQEERLVLKTLRSGRLTRGPVTTSFETEFARYIGVRHGPAVSGATAALHLALLAHSIGSADNDTIHIHCICRQHTLQGRETCFC